METFAITITRQFGSLGRPIAQKLSEILGIEFYDRDIVEKVSAELNMDTKTISDNEESVKNSFFNMQFPLGTATTDTQDKIFLTQSRIIQTLAEKENCIIVGRCSEYILRDKPNLLSIFIYAPLADRLENCVDSLHMDAKTARKMIANVDKARDAYHKRYANYLPSDINHQDILINSATLGVDGTAEVLAEIIRKRFNLD